MIFHLLYLSFIHWCYSQTVAPVWVTSDYFQAGNHDVINDPSTVGSGSRPNHTFTFATSFSATPSLGYGIKHYEGDDYLIQERFEVVRYSLSNSQFIVEVQIFGVTNIYVLNVPYIAVDADFPHHLNTFDNVPVNYSSGNLVNISSQSSSLQSYKNTFNYTQQAAGRKYTNFEEPFSNNKILLFLTSIYIATPYKTDSSGQIDYYVNTTIQSSEQYSISISVFQQTSITRLHFSQIIFDIHDVQQSNQYVIVQEQIDVPGAGQFIQIPSQFVDNFIMGLLDFSTSQHRAALYFNWEFTTSSGNHGVQVAQSIPKSHLTQAAFTRQGVTIFYIKTWNCPDYYLFDESSDLCVMCNISNCLTCGDPSRCVLCDEPSNYYDNATGLCELCSIPYCLNCSSLAQCLQCNLNESYYLVEINQSIPYDPSDVGLCVLCNSSENYFINQTSQQCELCTLSNCLNCSSFTACIECNQTAGYYLDVNTYTCGPCPVSNCLTCQTISECADCDAAAGYQLNTTDKQCYPCQDGYAMNQTLEVCVLCGPHMVSNCIICQTLTTCRVCDYNNSYYVVKVGQDPPYDPLNIGTCDFCNSTENYYINDTNLDCELCTLTQCLNCTSLTTCVECNETAQYFLNLTSAQCQPCPIPYCLKCSSFDTCSLCNSTAGYELNETDWQCYHCQPNYFINMTTLKCAECSLFISDCMNCASEIQCLVCDYNNSFYVVEVGQEPPYNASLLGTCHSCNSTQNYYINGTNLHCELCTLTQCLNCSNLETCAECNQTAEYFLDYAGDNHCYPCSLYNCLSCETLYLCQQCNETLQYFLNYTDKQCNPCSLEGCINCSTLYTCYQCNQTDNYYFSALNSSICAVCNESCSCDGYYLPWDSSLSQCTPICGDGLIRLSEECDDNNTDDGDGCSSTCQIQAFYLCFNEPSSCFLSLNLTIDVVSIEKTGCNSFQLILSIDPKLPDFAEPHLLQIISIYHGNLSSVSESYDHETGQVVIDAQYQKDLYDPTIRIVHPFDPQNVTYSPSIPPMHYTQPECEGAEAIEEMLKAVQGISYAILFASMLSCKIVGLQLFGVLQLAYFNLGNHDFLHMHLAPLAAFKSFNGLNIEVEEQNDDMPEQLKEMEMYSSFVNNFNIMELLMIAELVVAVTVIVVSVIIQSKKGKKVGLRLLKEGFLTLILFNSLNIGYSAGIHWEYADPSSDLYILSTFSLYIMLTVYLAVFLCLQMTSSSSYGEFKDKFKDNWVCRFYIAFTLLYRIFLGIYIAVNNDYELGTTIILGLSLAFILYNIINLPYKNVFQNYRANIIHLSHLMVTSYYRSMKSTTPMEEKAHMNTAAHVELGAIVVCLVVSFLVLIYELVKFFQKVCKECIRNKNVKNENNVTEESFANVKANGQ